jgi:HSP20 family protein
MADNMLQRSDWPDRMSSTDPVKQLFDRMFESRSTRTMATKDRAALAHPWVPQVDIKEEERRFIVYVDAPGITPHSIKVHLEHGVLTISGVRKTESQDCRESFLHVERRYGTFHRHFALPACADPRNITVTARDGILYIIVRKRPNHASRQIWVAKVGADESAGADKPFDAPWLMA